MTTGSERANDAATIAAIGALAAVMVTVAHEALGHGSVCAAVGGDVTLLTTSLFGCSEPSFLIDLGGPLTSLAVALAAGLASRAVGAGRPGLILFLTLVASMAAFWEGGYLVQAMLTEHGDLYFAWSGLVGEASILVRGAGVVIGVDIYVAGLVFASRSLARLAEPRWVARTAWMAATVATVAAALLYRGGLGDNLRDTFLAIGVASLPLLVIAPRISGAVTARPIRRHQPVIGAVALVWLAFALTMGRGLGV
ncbi:MAG: hypothetical protein KKA16_03355 [Alphaproteobacteria bacterium]|nr:hypothetical protein [Alphaproteobacteria bacterium]MBU2378176.1 hypothetical protein [Alphaproteobacteria bacterium]